MSQWVPTWMVKTMSTSHVRWECYISPLMLLFIYWEAICISFLMNCLLFSVGMLAFFFFEGALYILKELALNLLKVKASLLFLLVYLLHWFEEFVFFLLWLDIPNFYFIASGFSCFCFVIFRLSLLWDYNRYSPVSSSSTFIISLFTSSSLIRLNCLLIYRFQIYIFPNRFPRCLPSHPLILLCYVILIIYISVFTP